VLLLMAAMLLRRLGGMGRACCSVPGTPLRGHGSNSDAAWPGAGRQRSRLQPPAEGKCSCMQGRGPAHLGAAPGPSGVGAERALNTGGTCAWSTAHGTLGR
jgi:hypothetical protein